MINTIAKIVSSLAIVLALAGPALADPGTDASIEHGKRLSMACAICHTFGAGEPNKIGPNLHGVIGATAGTRGTFNFSPALKQSGIVWTDENLDAWLKRPGDLVKGTKMAYVGMPNPADRADLILYLKQATN